MDWRPFMYGGIASMVAEVGTFPIDLTKTRLQIQGQKIDSNLSTLKYRGMTHALITIAKEEGIRRGLYSGIGPALLRQATYGPLKIGLYYTMKKMVFSDPKDETLALNVVLGVIAGATGSTIANPTDVLKVRMQASSSAVREGMLAAFLEIYRKEGVGGLWRGVIPTGQRAAVVAGVELPVYDVCKKHILSSGYLQEGILTHFLASFIAGFAGAVASNPIDVIKTRLMNQKNLKSSVIQNTGGQKTPAIYKSASDCFVQTVKSEGVMALYKGFIPTWFRLGPWNVLFFITYEQLKNLY